jgi:hypothetical protein
LEALAARYGKPENSKSAAFPLSLTMIFPIEFGWNLSWAAPRSFAQRGQRKQSAAAAIHSTAAVKGGQNMGSGLPLFSAT